MGYFNIDTAKRYTEAINRMDDALHNDRGYGLLYRELDMFNDLFYHHDTKGEIVKDIDEYFYNLYMSVNNPFEAIKKEYEYNEPLGLRSEDY